MENPEWRNSWNLQYSNVYIHSLVSQKPCTVEYFLLIDRSFRVLTFYSISKCLSTSVEGTMTQAFRVSSTQIEGVNLFWHL